MKKCQCFVSLDVNVRIYMCAVAVLRILRWIVNQWNSNGMYNSLVSISGSLLSDVLLMCEYLNILCVCGGCACFFAEYRIASILHCWQDLKSDLFLANMRFTLTCVILILSCCCYLVGGGEAVKKISDARHSSKSRHTLKRKRVTPLRRRTVPKRLMAWLWMEGHRRVHRNCELDYFWIWRTYELLKKSEKLRSSLNDPFQGITLCCVTLHSDWHFVDVELPWVQWFLKILTNRALDWCWYCCWGGEMFQSEHNRIMWSIQSEHNRIMWSIQD